MPFIKLLEKKDMCDDFIEQIVLQKMTSLIKKATPMRTNNLLLPEVDYKGKKQLSRDKKIFKRKQFLIHVI